VDVVGTHGRVAERTVASENFEGLEAHLWRKLVGYLSGFGEMVSS
jgi:hypothetical protein